MRTLLDWIAVKFRAVVTLCSDIRRDLRNRYSNFYPHGMLRRICRRYPDFSGIEIFIETGTFEGKTACQESHYFREVHTIELNEDLYASNMSVFKRYDNIQAYHGDCVDVLPKILDGLSEPCLFFLDAHWSGDNSVDWNASEWKGFDVETSYRGEKWPPEPAQQCPLIDEAGIISAYPYRSVVIIDDWDVAGTKNLKFKGEDWSTITLENILGEFDSSRVVSHFIMKYETKERLIILLKGY